MWDTAHFMSISARIFRPAAPPCGGAQTKPRQLGSFFRAAPKGLPHTNTTKKLHHDAVLLGENTPCPALLYSLER